MFNKQMLWNSWTTHYYLNLVKKSLKDLPNWKDVKFYKYVIFKQEVFFLFKQRLKI